MLCTYRKTNGAHIVNVAAETLRRVCELSMLTQNLARQSFFTSHCYRSEINTVNYIFIKIQEEYNYIINVI